MNRDARRFQPSRFAHIQMTASMKSLVAANWKMHKTVAEAVAFVRELLAIGPIAGRRSRLPAVRCNSQPWAKRWLNSAAAPVACKAGHGSERRTHELFKVFCRSDAEMTTASGRSVTSSGKTVAPYSVFLRHWKSGIHVSCPPVRSEPIVAVIWRPGVLRRCCDEAWIVDR